LDKKFNFGKLKILIKSEQRKIKQVLMDPSVIAGIGNIYSDEILWKARINPFRETRTLDDKNLKEIYDAMKEVLIKAIELKGDSMSDYRLITGEKGGYQNVQKVYRQEGKPCPRKDGGIIETKKLGGRSAHYCPVCQA